MISPLSATDDGSGPSPRQSSLPDPSAAGHSTVPAGGEARHWHSRDVEAVLGELHASSRGLSPDVAHQRLAQFGPNVIRRMRSDGPLAVLVRQFRNPLIYVLIAAAVLALAMGEIIDGAVVLAVVALNAIIGFVQEYRAGKAIEALADMVPEATSVRREGVRVSVPAAELVPGDVVLLEAGDKVPADLRVMEARNLRIEEAALTGESVPVDKSLRSVASDAPLGDRTSMAFGGTLVASGAGAGVVVATGGETELGRISAMLGQTVEVETPLTRALASVGGVLTVVISAVAVLLVGVGLLRGYPLVDAILAAITLAVAAIPEGLPAIVTISLAIGVQRMAGRRAVIRSLPAVETLGSTTVICSDKTGTLTRNEMTVQALWTSAGEIGLTGIGWAPDGELQVEGRRIEQLPEQARELLRAGVLCNDARIERVAPGWRVAGDPTEAALLVSAAKAGLDQATEARENPRLDVLPFDSDLRLMATLHRVAGGSRVIFLKGAPEVVLARCRGIAGQPGGLDPAPLLVEVERLASRGMRVLALAVHRSPRPGERIELGDLEAGFELLGFQGMIDPPRPEAIDAVRRCHEAGIVVKMITGDHRATAAAIGAELGLGGRRAALEGADLERLSDEELVVAARETSVFARVAPEHKLELVRLLQRGGAVVAMTGDGVNDAPALRQANVGVAMGITGTAVSREAADMVLVDDNFATITAAVEEGRRVHDNLVKSLAFVLPTNVGEALVILAAVLLFPIVDGTPLLPMLPVQILWINLVATVALALPLAFEAMEPDLMRRPPRDPDAPILSRFVLARTAIVAVLMAAVALGLFQFEYDRELARGTALARALSEAQTLSVTGVVLLQIFYVLQCRSLKDSVWRIGLGTNPAIWVGIVVLVLLQLAFVYAPPMQRLFGSASLDVEAWLTAAAGGAMVLPVVGLEKRWRRRA